MRAGQPQWESDIEAYILSANPLARQRIRAVGRRVTRAIGVDVAVDWMTPRRWQRLASRNIAGSSRLTLQMWDLAATGRFIQSEPASRPALPPVGRIGQVEGLRLLLNRVVETTGKVELGATEQEIDRWLRKIMVATTDGHLLLLGSYRPYLRERAALTRDRSAELANLLDVPEDLVIRASDAADDLLAPAPDLGHSARAALASDAVALGRAGLASLSQRLGFGRLAGIRDAESWLELGGFSHQLDSYHIPVAGAAAENAAAFVRARLARVPLRPRAAMSRTAVVYRIWALAPTMLQLLDPALLEEARAAARTRVTECAVSLSGPAADGMRSLVAIWRAVA